MFGCICLKWRNKPVVFAHLVLNSWWQCMHSAFLSSFSWKCAQTELLFTFFLYTISSALLPATITLLSLDIFFKDFQSLLNSHRFWNIYVWASRISQRYCSTAYIQCPSTKHAVTRFYTSGHTILKIRVSNKFSLAEEIELCICIFRRLLYSIVE